MVHRGSQMMMCTEVALRYDQKSMKLHTRVSFVSPLSSNPLMQNSFCGTLFGNVLFTIYIFLLRTCTWLLAVVKLVFRSVMYLPILHFEIIVGL